MEDTAYPLAVGIDAGSLYEVRLSLKIPISQGATQGGASGSGGSSDGTGKGQESRTSFVTSIETDSIHAGLNVIESYLGRHISLAHAKQVVISEGLARRGGLHEHIHGMQRGRQFRPTTNIFVCIGAADEFLKKTNPVSNMNESKFYELINGSYTHTGFGVDSTVFTFYIGMESTYKSPIAALEAVNIYDAGDEFNLNNSTAYQKGREKPMAGNYFAGEIPRTGGPPTEIMGIAVFRGDKMVGMMDGEDTKYYLITSGNFQKSFLTVPDPLDEESFIVLSIRQNRKPDYNVKIKDGIPYIDLKVDLEGDFTSIQSAINYEDVNNINIAEKATEEFLKKGIIRYLEATSKEFGSDINGFGGKARMLFPDWEKWEKYDWLEKYKDAVFNLSVSFKIRRTGLLIRSILMKGEEAH